MISVSFYILTPDARSQSQLYVSISNKEKRLRFATGESFVTAYCNIRKKKGTKDLLKKNTEFYFDTANAISKAADANISNAVLVSQKILAEENGNMLLDANAIFLGENMSQIKPTPFPGPMGQMSLLGMLNKEKSKGKINFRF